VREDGGVPLDDFLPDYDVNEVHSTRIAAPPEAVLAAVRALTPREVPLTGALMAIRTLPAILARRRRPSAGNRRLDDPLLDGLSRRGFAMLAERPDELVLGAIGRFWKAEGEILRVGSDEFVTFDEPGFAKAVVNFHVQAVSGGTVVTTETRVRCTDEEARRTFRRYWRIVMPGSALIRRAWLRAIRRRAEAASARGR
jgi:hypothetical protein